MQEVLEAKDGVKVMETKIVEYSATAAGLADLQHRFRDVVFDVTTTKGMTDAKAARYELVKLRTGLEAKRVELKAPALERSRLIDTEAKRIEEKIRELERPFDHDITAEEERKKAEKRAREEAEAARIADIRERINSIAMVPMRAANKPSAEVEAKLKLVVAIEIGTDYAEFADEARNTQTAALESLRALLADAKEHEAEQAKLAEERAELERLRREDAERKRADEEAAAAARKAETERLASERRQLEQEQRTQREEQARLDSEAADRRRKADQEAADARAKADRDAREAREAEETRIAEQRAQLGREQDERDRVAKEENRKRIEEEHDRLMAEGRARDKLQGAAQTMLDALLLWRVVDGARMARTTDGYKDAAKAREDAIFAATGTPSGT